MCSMCVRSINHTCYFKGSKDADTSEHKTVGLWGGQVLGHFGQASEGARQVAGTTGCWGQAQPRTRVRVASCHVHCSGLTSFAFTETQKSDLWERK